MRIGPCDLARSITNTVTIIASAVDFGVAVAITAPVVVMIFVFRGWLPKAEPSPLLQPSLDCGVLQKRQDSVGGLQ